MPEDLTHRAVPVTVLEDMVAGIDAILTIVGPVLAPDIKNRIESIGLRLAPRHFLPIVNPETMPGWPADNPNSIKPPDYIWREPNGDGWIDAWNGWYETLDEALADTNGGSNSGPRILTPGQGLIDRDNPPEPNPQLVKLLADWFQGELNFISERSSDMYNDWQAAIDDAKARHEALDIPWDDAFVPEHVREMLD